MRYSTTRGSMVFTGCAALSLAAGMAQAQQTRDPGPRPVPALARDGDPLTQLINLFSHETVTLGTGGLPGQPPATDGDVFFLSLGASPEADEHADAKYLPDGSGLVVANRRSKNLVILHPDTRALISAIPLTQRPHALAINAAGTIAVTANLHDGTASIVNLATGVETVIPTGVFPASARITPDGTRALIHNNGRVLTTDPYGKLTVIDLATATIEREVTPTGFSNMSGAINFEWHAFGLSREFLSTTGPLLHDNTRVVFPVWTNVGDTQVLIIDYTTGTTTPVTVPAQPRLAVIHGTKAYVVHTGSLRRVTEIDIPSATVSNTFTSAVDLNGAAAINAAGTRLALNVQNNFVVLDLTAGVFTGNLGPQASVNALYTTRDGDHFMAASIQGTIANFNGAVVQNFAAPTQFILGAVSPTTDRAAMLSAAFGEDTILINTAVGGVAQLAGGPSGPAPEADKPRKVAVNAAGTRAVTANVLSRNASVIDVTTRTTLATLPIQARAGEVGITPDGSKAVITSRDGTGVDIIDLTELTVTPVALGAAPIRADALVFSPDSQYAYTATIGVANGADGVYRITLATGAVSPRVPVGDMTNIVNFAFAFAGIALSPDGSTLVTCNSSNNATFGNSLTFIDTATMTVTATVPVAVNPFRAAFAPGGQRLYVSSMNSATVSAIDTTTSPPSVVGSLPLGAGSAPFELRVNPAGTRAYVQVGTPSPTIAVLDITANTPVELTRWTFPTNPTWAINAFDLSADGTKAFLSRGTASATFGNGGAFITENGTFQVIDTATGGVIDEAATGRYATGMGRSADGTVIVTADTWNDAVSIIGEPPAACYANCDQSTQPPILNVADFGCFLTRYAAGEPYANCDESTQAPVLNVADFGCFLTRYAAGCL